MGNTISIKDASGNEITSTSHIGNINPIRYRGYYLDKEINFYYLGSRYYDPEVSRFISSDDIGVISLDNTSLYDKNLYAYCDNNPVSREDESGYFWFTVAGIFVGAALSGISKVFSNYMTGQGLKNWLMGAIIGGAVAGGITISSFFLKTFTSSVGLIASYAGAVAESITNEVETYRKGKVLSVDNLTNSVGTVFSETIGNGTMDLIFGQIPGYEIPTNHAWFRPKYFKSSFF